MRKIERKGKYWTLTILRNGMDEGHGGLEESEFRFGRFSGELSDPEKDAKHIPSGLLTALEVSGIGEQAEETGFSVEMSNRKQEGFDWVEFFSIATVSEQAPWGKSRTLYSCSEGTTLEFIRILSCSMPAVDLSQKIWIRVTELPEEVVMWAVENDVFKADKTRQMALDHWFEFSAGDSPSPSDDQIIPMPGPVGRPYGFLY